jgi:hypothetical protein
LLFCVIVCVGCVLTACKLWFHRNLHAVNTHSLHAITLHSNCAEPQEDGHVTPETCRGMTINKKKLRKVNQFCVDSLMYHDARSTKLHVITSVALRTCVKYYYD